VADQIGVIAAHPGISETLVFSVPQEEAALRLHDWLTKQNFTVEIRYPWDGLPVNSMKAQQLVDTLTQSFAQDMEERRVIECD
jgi:hypothetical protein